MFEKEASVCRGDRIVPKHPPTSEFARIMPTLALVMAWINVMILIATDAQFESDRNLFLLEPNSLRWPNLHYLFWTSSNEMNIHLFFQL